MNRRKFLAASGAVGLAPLSGLCGAAEGSQGGRDYYELQQYELETEAQKKLFDAYMKEAAIPALNRLGINPVGVFFPQEGLGPAYVVLRAKALDVLAGKTQKLLADEEYLRKGAEFLDAPAAMPAFKRMESSLMVAFKGMPALETPIRTPGRVVQLRTYESPSVKTGQKKIEMFNDAGEIEIFRRVGLNPVFFGETIVGAKMPNLTYMLIFNSLDDQKAAWQKFRTDPAWLKLRAIDEYGDKVLLCGITNLLLKPADYSQI